jgi:pyruvate formate lyase activating enzyme
MDPKAFAKLASEWGCIGVSLSFNEPTLLFEYALDLFPLARERGLVNTFVTNGYMTLEALKMLHDSGMDAINIDVKGDVGAVRKYCGIDVDVVWRNAHESKKLGMHVEIVNLVVPSVNDREEQTAGLVGRHIEEVGSETPLHFTAYSPAYKFTAPPTPVATLERARRMAVSRGIDFVYVGNVALGHPYENTYCPDCGQLLIERYGLDVTKVDLVDDKCPRCGRKIPIVGKANVRRYLREGDTFGCGPRS